MEKSKVEMIRQWLWEAAEIAMQKQDNIEFAGKGDGTLSTEVDRELELFFRERLLQAFPDDMVLGEEFGLFSENPGAAGEAIWFVDPVDGTDSYCAGLFSFGISLARYQNGNCLYAAICLPSSRLLLDFYDGMTSLNAQPFVLSERPVPPILFAPSHFHREFRIEGSRKLRLLGSVCFHAVQLLRGLAQGVFVSGAYLWDLAAVVPLLSENGCLFYDLDGSVMDFSFSEDAAKIDTPFLISRPQYKSELLRDFCPLDSQPSYITAI
jgi:myo-inositol-1(or 4)-monophosphatase